MQPDGKLRAYHRGTLREDLPGRFDYLFEPLEADESAGDGHDDSPERPRSPRTTTDGHAE
jgi:hypothetical protein